MAKALTTSTAPELPYQEIGTGASRDNIRDAIKEDEGRMSVRTTYLIPFNKIDIRQGFNVRYDMGDIEGLAKDILQNGLITPLTVDLVLGKKKKWIVEIGHRRFHALKLLNDQKKLKDMNLPGIKEGAIECFVNQTDVDELTRIIRLFSSNHSKDLTALEMAEVVRRLEIYYEKPHAQIAEILGVSRQQVDNYAILYKLDDQTKQSIMDGGLTPTEAIALARDVKKRQKEADEKNQKGTSKHSSSAPDNEHKINTPDEHIDEHEFEPLSKGESIEGDDLPDEWKAVEEDEPENESAEQAGQTGMHSDAIFESIGNRMGVADAPVQEFISRSNPEAEAKEEYQLCNRVIQNADKMIIMSDHLPDKAMAGDFQRLLRFIINDMEPIREYVKKCRK